jgi:photosystem II stability/assembly factor-like uncharacterized protein
LLFLTSCFTNLYAQTYGWIYLGNNIPGDSLFHDLSDIYFINDVEGWVTSSSHAEIYHTTDGGETFEVQTTAFPCNAIWMLNENEGYAGGQSGFVYRTTDGGTNWNFHGTITTTLTDISFPPQPADTGYACGFNGKIYKVHPSGVISMTSNVGTTDLSSITFPTTTEGWACGEQVVVHYINNWITDQTLPFAGYNNIFFIDNNNGWAVGDNGIIIRTIDGMNWFTQTNPDSNSLFDVFFLNENEGWTVGFNGSILRSSNGGSNWNIEGAGITNNFLRAVHIPSLNTGYVAGNHKTLYKFGILPSVDESNISPSAFSLRQNYPNPFNLSTLINYLLLKQSFISLKVYDVLGNKVSTLVHEEKPTGEYEVEFSGKGLTTGIYFYQLIAGQFLDTKKMILIK